jgi:thiol-disulfide isomerase/thioredoxin
MIKRKNLILMLILMMATIGLTFWYDFQKPPLQPHAIETASSQNLRAQKPPEFSFADYRAKSRTDLNLNAFKGRLVLLHFWATWCAPCVIEFPKLIELANLYPDDIAVIAVSTDSTTDIIDQFLKKFPEDIQQKSKNANFIVVWDKDKKISQDLFQTIRLPETIILNREGFMQEKIIGDLDWLDADIQKKTLGLSLTLR